jgi:hypothetical protein
MANTCATALRFDKQIAAEPTCGLSLGVWDGVLTVSTPIQAQVRTLCTHAHAAALWADTADCLPALL